MSACKSCWKSFKDRNSIKSSLSLIKVRLKCNYLNYVYFQFVKFSNKTSIAATAVKICFPFTIINKFKIYPLLSDKNYYNSDQMNHACLKKNHKIYQLCLMNLIPSHLISITPKKD